MYIGIIMHKLALLVSIYNSNKWIEKRLENLLLSTANIDAEIICINANSEHELDHKVFLDKYSQEPRIKYIKLNERIGIYDAWNMAIEHSNSEYLSNANTDDLSTESLYTKSISILDTNKDVGVVYSSWYSINDVDPINHPLQISHPGQFAGDFNKGQVGHFPTWRKCIHDEIGLFDGSLTALGDADFWARVYFTTKNEFFWIREPLGYYRWRNGDNAWTRFISPEQWRVFYDKCSKYRNQ